MVNWRRSAAAVAAAAATVGGDRQRVGPGRTLLQHCGLVGQLVLVFVLEALLLHLLPVRLQFAVGPFGLEDFDLAAGGVDVLDVVAVLVGGERVHLDPEGHALLSTVLPGGELGADAIDLDEDGSILGRVPEELDGVEVQRV